MLPRGGPPRSQTVSRPDEHGEAVGREVLRDLEADSFVGPGDEGDGLVLHRGLFERGAFPRPALLRDPVGKA